ncbi:FAD-binding domain-containing protein [Wolfiporia cocos MD-104 SS10]|uniref:FAD-binding domain-containing protein n=1 Tax=Wolfiporia cocos (strain MD-104) TaxID=742152 RepID=A0A2H3JLS9_WOLCO|nr:FAD-binding domain-containing protein [Wolfiporia cocos MD-104 SS10]
MRSFGEILSGTLITINAAYSQLPLNIPFNSPWSPSVSVTSRLCKCLPGDSCFPSQQEWNQLSQRLSQPLIYGQRPFASVCYNTSSDFSPAACKQAMSERFNETSLAESSNTIMWTIFEDIITPHGIEQCPFESGPDEICHQGRVPSISVNATSVEDIQLMVEFSSQHNLHLVVKNTGHELMGRDFGVGSVEIFTHYLKGINFTNDFTPSGVVGDRAGGQHAVTIGAGVQWGELYAAAEKNNRSVVGAFPPYVGVGVDNVLQFTVVLPNASFVTANDYQNTDLFWALRGGGGPSFGVVTSVTYKTHPNVPYTAAYYIARANSSDSYLELFKTWTQYNNLIEDAGWSGAWPFGGNTLNLSLITQGIPPFKPLANATLEAFFTASRSIPGIDVTLATSASYSSFYEWYSDNLGNNSHGYGINLNAGAQVGIPTALASWLVPREVFYLKPDALADVLMKMPGGNAVMIGGGAVASADPDSVAVTPAWRRMTAHILLTTSWNQTSDPAVVEAARKSVRDQVEPLRQLAPLPIGGQYINEADILEHHWQEAYWGSHYPRLLSIKKAIDPHDLLVVYKGVNSEQWDDEIVCKTL